MNSDAASRQIRVSQLLRAPINLAWQVWTNADDIANWWGPNGFTNTIHKMELTAGGEWNLTMHGPDGKNYANRSRFKEIIPHQQIVFEHYNPNYLATITFEPQGDETLISWTMEFETVELFDTVVKVFKADEGLKQNVEKLQAYLAEKTKS